MFISRDIIFQRAALGVKLMEAPYVTDAVGFKPHEVQ